MKDSFVLLSKQHVKKLLVKTMYPTQKLHTNKKATQVIDFIDVFSCVSIEWEWLLWAKLLIYIGFQLTQKFHVTR